MEYSNSVHTLEGQFITIFYPEDDEEGRQAGLVTNLNVGSGQYGFSFMDEDFIWSRDGSAINPNGFVSDASIVVARDGEFLSMFGGTSLTYNGVTYITSSISTNAVVEIVSGGLEVVVGEESLMSEEVGVMNIVVGGLDANSDYVVEVNGGAGQSYSTDGSGRLYLSVSTSKSRLVIS